MKIAPVILMLILVVVGGIGGFIYASQNPVTPPAEHQGIINTMIITDTVWNVQLTPKCVDSAGIFWAKHQIVELDAFTEGREYYQSTWVWQRYGDTEMVMTIWGPGEDQTTCLIEIAKLAGNSFSIVLKGETILDIAKSSESMQAKGECWACEGYYTLHVEIR